MMFYKLAMYVVFRMGSLRSKRSEQKLVKTH